MINNFWRENHVTELAQCNKELQSLPAEIGLFTSLKTLNLNFNELSSLPAEFENLTALEILELSCNKFENFPMVILKLTGLKELSLIENGFRTLPGEIGNLTRLYSLNISKNKVKRLPSEIGNMAALETLVISKNQIEYLPVELLKCKKLSSINLGESTYLKEVPVWLAQIGALRGDGCVYVTKTRIKRRIFPQFMECFSAMMLARQRTIDLRLKTWAALDGSPINLTLLAGLTQPQIAVFNQWLMLLERGNVFAYSQIKLAGMITAVFQQICKESNFILMEGCSEESAVQLLHEIHGRVPPPAPIEAQISEREVEEIKKRINGQSTELNLTGLGLRSLPSLLWELTHLTKLVLDDNELTSLPSGIGNLRQLTLLSAEKNKIEALPYEIVNLRELRVLNFNSNQIEALPPGIGGLQHLTVLKAAFNRLEFIPPEIGRCIGLHTLDLHNNPYLHVLPMSLGQLTNITYLHVAGMGCDLDLNVVRTFFQQWQNLRAQDAIDHWRHRVNIWKAAGKSECNLEAIERFTQEHKIDLNEWLVRLERTRDFTRIQEQLASKVCNILESLCRNAAFKELFFAQVQSNNENCMDRAGMAFNEIYTAWKICCMPEETPLKEKLKIMTGAAKVLSLRKEIAKRVPANEKESVEIYLYFEILLRKRLDLCSAMEEMTYVEIGRRGWIDVEQLVETVNRTFFDELMALPIFERMAKEQLKEEWERLMSQAHAALNDCPPGDHYDEEVKQIQLEFEAAWKAECRTWYESLLNS